MKQNSVLFELCRQVYRLTKWDSDDLLHHLDGEVYHRPLFESDVKSDPNSYHPLYTSDYLLEKLPEEVNRKILVVTNGDRPHAGYAERDNYGNYSLDNSFYESCSYSDTALKALLKLIVALHETGELPV